MVSTNDINSTEKLLNVIRGKNIGAFERNDKPKDVLSLKKSTKKVDFKLSKFFSHKKHYTVGVDLGHESIRMAKTIRASDGRPILLDQKIVKYSHLTSKYSPEFNELLKSSLVPFCGSLADCNVWTMISAGEVNVRHIKIPRVQKKQLENVIYWTAKKENSIDEKDSVFDFELQGGIIDQGIAKYSVMVYTAPKVEIEKIKTLFSDMGITLAGITIAPFAIQNIFRTKSIPVSEENFASLFIGNDFSRIDIYSKDNLVMTRGFKTGTSSMIEAIVESMKENNDGLKLEKEEAKKILFSLGSDSERLRETDVGFDINEKEIFEMIIPPLERLTRQIERTLEYYMSSVGHEKVEKLFISSTIPIYDSIVSYITDQLGIINEIFDPCRQMVIGKAAESVSLSERMCLVPALGLSFSDNAYTPNAIFTYRDKNRELNIRKINIGIFASFAAVLVICIGILIYQSLEVINLNRQKEKLKKELAFFETIISSDKISKITEEVKIQRDISRQYAQRYLGIAAISEVTALTPVNIRLINLKITSGSPAPKDVLDKKTKETGDSVVFEGVVFGDNNMLDSLLTQYVMKLEKSPMLREVSVQKNKIVNFKNVDVLHFTVNAKIG